MASSRSASHATPPAPPINQFLGPERASGDPGLRELARNPYRFRQATVPALRSKSAAMAFAVEAARAGTPLSLHLVICSDWYHRHYPQLNLSPNQVVIDGDEVVVCCAPSGFSIPRSVARSSLPAGYEVRHDLLAATATAGAERFAGTVTARQGELAEVNTKLAAARAERDLCRAARDAAVVAGDAALSGKTRSLGRPEQRHGLAIAGLASVAVFGLGCEAVVLSAPLLNLLGIDVTNLSAEFQRSPFTVISGVASGVGVTLSLTIVGVGFVRCVRRCLDAGSDLATKILTGAGALVCAASGIGALVGIAEARASLRPAEVLDLAGTAAQTDISFAAFLGLASLFPIATAILLEVIHERLGGRAAIEKEQEAWDEAHVDAAVVRAQLEERLALAEERIAMCSREKTGLEGELVTLSQWAETAETVVRERHDAERKTEEALIDAVVASLAQDKHCYLIAAQERASGANAASSAALPGPSVLRGSFRRILQAIGAVGLCLTVLGITGCGGAERAPVVPIHTSIVCADADACDPIARGATFDTWWREVLYKPDSTCAVWAAGEARDSYALIAVAKIPLAWGRNVTAAKAAFRVAARAAVVGEANSPHSSAAVPSGAVPPDGSVPGRYRLTVIGAAKATMSPTTWVSRGDEAPLRHDAVVCDASGSGGGQVCNELTLLATFDAFSAGAAPGATLVVHVVGHSRDSDERLFTVTVPSLPPGPRAAYLFGARAELQAIAASGLRSESSAIIEAASVAVRDLRSYEHGRLVLLSDLRQVTPGHWNFEEAVPPPEAFIEALRSEALFLDLAGIPVTVVGVHHRRGPEGAAFDARAAAAVEETWTAALTAMGAPSVRIFPDTLPAGTFEP